MQIASIGNFSKSGIYFNKKNTQQNNYSVQPNKVLSCGFNDYLLTFTSRVDKGLERFYDANRDRMPIPVKRYVNALDDKSCLTPLEAQRRAFIALEDAETIEDIKKAFRGDELFDNLKRVDEIKATRGILALIKEDAELLELSGEGILKDNSDFTVYLVKKIFLEAKTIDEINQDLEKDLNNDLKADFKFKNKDGRYIYTTTLQSLGIQTPDREYQHSLRFTRDGYSDKVGENISKSRILFLDSLTEEQRLNLSKKSVQNIEKWWEEIPYDTKMEMLSGKITMDEMYESYRKNHPKKTASTTKSTTNHTKTHYSVESNKLSEDELFKKWASLNLKLYEENLSEQDKYNLNIRRTQNLSSRWANMTAIERTDYINRLKSGSEPLRFTMIDAWNNSVDIIKELVLHLKQNQVFKPADLLYATDEFSEYQSKVMTEFWENNPEFAVQLGENIKKSQEKINSAIKKGTFEVLKKEIARAKNLRIKDLNNFKTEIKSQNAENTLETKDFVSGFKDAYMNSMLGKIKSTPNSYINDLLKVVQENIPQENVEIWVKLLRNEPVSAEEYKLFEDIQKVTNAESNRISYALESAFADALYNATKDPSVFEMGISDVKTAMYHLERKEHPIRLKSLSNGKFYELTIKNPKINTDRINAIYNFSKKDLNELELEQIINRYFMPFENIGDKEIQDIIKNSVVSINGFNYGAMKDYLAQYGNSLTILFSEKSVYPMSVKRAFYNKIKNNAPEKLKSSFEKCFLEGKDGFEREEKIIKCMTLFKNKYSFVPSMYMDSYFKSFSRILRATDSEFIENFEKRCCKKRKEAKDGGAVVLLPKETMDVDAKLCSLIVEQALADVLYEATGEVKVYQMEFEELCDNIELFSLVKKFPSVPRIYNSQSFHEPVLLKIDKKLNLNKIERLTKEYMDEIKTVLAETPNIQPEDILYVLNPYEDRPNVDKAVMARLSKYMQVQNVK